MKNYDYVALGPDGKKTTGTIMATTARHAREQLRGRSLSLLDLSPAAEKKRIALRSSRKVKPADMTRAARTLSTLLSTGIPVEEALRITAPLFDGTALREKLLRSQTLVTEGSRLSAALSETQAFRDLHIAMIAAGENGGFLPAVMERLADDLEAEEKIRNKIVGAMVYPLVLVAVALIVITLLLVYLVPQVVSQFESFGEDLPRLTKFVIGLSDFIKASWPVLLGIIVLFPIGYKLAVRQPNIRRAVDRFKLRLPIFGNLIAHINAGRFARNMAGLLGAGTPGVNALQTSQHTLNNLVLKDEVVVATRRVREGGALHTAFARDSRFPGVFLQMIAAGERSGKLPDMFGKSAEYMDSEVDSKITIMLNLLEPLIIVLLSVFVVLVIAAIFLPILKIVTLV